MIRPPLGQGSNHGSAAGLNIHCRFPLVAKNPKGGPVMLTLSLSIMSPKLTIQMTAITIGVFRVYGRFSATIRTRRRGFGPPQSGLATTS
jgi:hypothetical protein